MRGNAVGGLGASWSLVRSNPRRGLGANGSFVRSNPRRGLRASWSFVRSDPRRRRGVLLPLLAAALRVLGGARAALNLGESLRPGERNMPLRLYGRERAKLWHLAFGVVVPFPRLPVLPGRRGEMAGTEIRVVPVMIVVVPPGAVASPIADINTVIVPVTVECQPRTDRGAVHKRDRRRDHGPHRHVLLDEDRIRRVRRHIDRARVGRNDLNDTRVLHHLLLRRGIERSRRDRLGPQPLDGGKDVRLLIEERRAKIVGPGGIGGHLLQDRREARQALDARIPRLLVDVGRVVACVEPL